MLSSATERLRPGLLAALRVAALALTLLPCVARAARADDAPPQPPPPPAADGTPPADVAPPAGGAAATTDVAPPAWVDPRGEPPPPPPPKIAIDSWDQDWRSRDVDLGPPLPPPDPFAPRHIRYRHDTRDVSVDGTLKEVKRVPQWVDVIDRDEITEWRPLDLGDLARRLPNVVVGDAGNPFLQIPSIRGFGGDRVKIMTDGVWPATQALGLFGGTLSLWDPESTERVEVYHGPGVYLKGLDSPGGVINVVPRRPRRHGVLTADGGLSTSYLSSARKFRQRAEADVGVNRIAALVGVTWTDAGNRDTGGGTIDPSGYSGVAADVALDWFLDNQSTIGITFQHVEAFDIDVPTGTGSSLANPGFERTFIALTLSSFDVGNVFHGHRMSIALDTFFAGTDDAFSSGGSGLGTTDDVDRFNFHLEGNLYLSPCHDTWAELDVAYAHLKRTETLLCNARGRVFPKEDGVAGGAMPFLRGPDGSLFAVPGQCNSVVQEYEAEEIVVSGLIEDQVHTECCDRHIGARLDWYRYEDNRPGAVNDEQFLFGAAAGIAKHLTNCHSVFANGSFGWRRPTIHERTANVVLDGKTILGDPSLDPEFHANAEVGIKAARMDRASLQAALFGHYTSDYIAPLDLFPPAANTAQLANLGDAFLYGIEVTGAWRPCTTIEGWELFGSAGTTRSTDDSLIHGLPLLWRAGSRYSVPQPQGYLARRWFAEFALHGASDSHDGPRGDDPYVTADALLGIGLDFGCRHAGWFNVGIVNLFDTDYVPPACVLPAPGLGVIASISLKF